MFLAKQISGQRIKKEAPLLSQIAIENSKIRNNKFPQSVVWFSILSSIYELTLKRIYSSLRGVFCRSNLLILS